MSDELQLIKLSEDHVEQVNQFLRNNAFTEPVMATFNGEKPVEGTVLEERNENHARTSFSSSIIIPQKGLDGVHCYKLHRSRRLRRHPAALIRPVDERRACRSYAWDEGEVSKDLAAERASADSGTSRC